MCLVRFILFVLLHDALRGCQKKKKKKNRGIDPFALVFPLGPVDLDALCVADPSWWNQNSDKK